MGPLERPRAARDVDIVPGLTGIREGILPPGALENFNALLEAGLSRVAIEPMLEVVAGHPAPQPHVQPSAREDVEHRALLREAHRIV